MKPGDLALAFMDEACSSPRELEALRDLRGLLASRDALLAALERLTKGERAICTCKYKGTLGGGGHRDPFGTWINGSHAPDCPHVQARAAIAASQGQS